MQPSLSGVPRFPLSIILAYLQQSSCSDGSKYDGGSSATSLPHNRGALSLLLTNKRFAYAILPLFRVPRRVCRNYQHVTKDGALVTVIEKYRFVVLPIQDPRTLLDRLNTRRLRGRRIHLTKELKDNDRHSDEPSETNDGIEVNHNQFENNKVHHSCAQDKLQQNLCYQPGRTIEELAFEEWAMMEINHNNSDSDECENDGRNNQWRIWPAHLELLQFLGEADDVSIPSQITGKQKRISSSKFGLRGLSLKRDDEGETANKKIETLFGSQAFGNQISLLASYPRSGNTLLRTLLERITSFVSGSDTRPDRTLSRSLALDHDLVGEGLVGGNSNQSNTKPGSMSSVHMQNLHQGVYDPPVYIVKTHFPERKGWKPVKGSKVLLLVRNPYDAIDSYWNLCCTNTHTRSLDESVYTKYAEKFEGLARHEIKIWCNFHYYWIDICKEERVPLLLVRYEDLVLDTEAEMLRVIKFLTVNHGVDNENELTSFWKWRIRHALGKVSAKTIAENSSASSTATANSSNQSSANTSRLGSYQPRSSSGGLISLGKSIRKKRYTESVLLHMHEVAVSLELERKHSKTYTLKAQDRHQKKTTLLQQFGYDIYTQNFPDNFKQPPPIESPESVKGKGYVFINKTPEIREKDDPFGRVMTFWRRGETDGDTKPFPTIAR